MKKLFVLFFLLFLPISPTNAVCPVCTVAIGAGLGISQWLGIDDLITSVWIGGLIASMVVWTIDWFDRKNIRFYGRKLLITLVYYASILVPLYLDQKIGISTNKFCGVDKIILGIFIGTFSLIFGSMLHNFLKRKNGDKVYFPFQKVAIPFGLLIVLSIILNYFCL